MRTELDDVTLNVQDTGAGSPVVLLHGWPDTADLWRYQVPALVAGGYRVIAPDLRGSASPAGRPRPRPTRRPAWSVTWWACSTTCRSNEPTWSATTGAPPSPG